MKLTTENKGMGKQEAAFEKPGWFISFFKNYTDGVSWS